MGNVSLKALEKSLNVWFKKGTNPGDDCFVIVPLGGSVGGAIEPRAEILEVKYATR